jgi:Zn-dependent protease
MFAIPAPTPYDLRFSLLGIPVRIHPLFWVMTAVLGWESHDRFYVLIWVACVLLSILVHEFGHALTARDLCRKRPAVILYLMGGLCVYDSDERRPWRRAAVLIMGPGAGFLLFGLVLALGLGALGFARIYPFGEIEIHTPPAWFFKLPQSLSIAILIAYEDLLMINFFWGLFNLLPMFPLDGGQLAHVALTEQNRREGAARTYMLGIATAGGLALYFASRAVKTNSNGDWINAFFVANLAFMNYQLLQAARAQRDSFGSTDQDDNWWRR